MPPFTSCSGRAAVPLPLVTRPFTSLPSRLNSRGIPPRRTLGLSTVPRAQAVADLPPSLKAIVGAFQMVPDPMARYKQLLHFASKLEAFPAEDRLPQNIVPGCVSQVWVTSALEADGTVTLHADSDSQLTKGLAALLCQGLSGSTPQEILAVEADFITQLGLAQSLTPSRSNGFLNMFKLVQRKALDLLAASAEGAEATTEAAAPEPAVEEGSSAESPAAADDDAPTSSTPVEDAMTRKLTEAFEPAELIIDNQSASHAGHAGSHYNADTGSTETHFKVTLVSEAFEGLNMVKRHRAVYGALQEELKGSVHALSLETQTPAEAGRA